MAIDAREAKAIGDIGECELRKWARQVGITANPVQCDEHGWDFILELPRGHMRSGSLSLDLIPCEFRCFVQVKTLTSEEGRTRINLANWRRMVHDPAPWFVLIVVLSAEREASSAFLVHVDENWCSRVLQRLRELPEAEAERIHERNLDVTWSETDRLPKLHGESLNARLRFHCGDDQNSYLDRKRTWVRDAGYGEGRHRLDFAIAGTEDEDPAEMMADFAVGLRPALPVRIIEAAETRFGISKPFDMSPPPDGRTEIQFVDRPPDEETLITIETADRNEVVHLRCATFASGRVFPDLPERYQKVRFVAPMFSATMQITPAPEASMMLRWQFPAPESAGTVTLGDLGRAARAILLLHTSRENPVRLSVRGTRGSFTRDDFSASHSVLTPDDLQAWTALDRAHQIAGRFRLSDDTLVVPRLLLKQRSALESLSVAMCGTVSDASFSATTTFAEPPTDTQAGITVLEAAVVGDRVLGAVVALVGTPQWAPLALGGYQMEATGAVAQVLRRFNVSREEWNDFDQRGTLEAARAELEQQGVSLVICPDDDYHPDETALEA